MKRKAIFIGNTNGLPGVKVDLDSFKNFLLTAKGGAWRENEIEILVNPSRLDTLTTITRSKSQNYDYALVLFSGHGGQERRTVLELNKYGECINDADLFDIAVRQVSIFDCCRAYPQLVTESRSLNMDSATASFSEASEVRKIYENRILQAIPQQIQIYSCAKGETAGDTPSGGIYTSNLLKSARSFYSFEKEKTVASAHEEAATQVVSLTKSKRDPQNPEIFSPRCLSSQQLILSINL